MYDIEMHEPTAEFGRCWNAAGERLQSLAPAGKPFWLKCTLRAPFLEHFSFRLGNQLFFVRLEDVEGALETPGTRRGLAAVAKKSNGHACIMLLERRGVTWTPRLPGWGLVSAETGQVVDPYELVTDELIEMTDWEVHDFAVQVVREKLFSDGRKLMSFASDPEIDPSIWFVGDDGPEWIVIRFARYPATSIEMPSNMEAIAANCARLSSTGHFASVIVASSQDQFDPEHHLPQPLWRGHQFTVRYSGLIPVERY